MLKHERPRDERRDAAGPSDERRVLVVDDDDSIQGFLVDALLDDG